MEGDCNTTVLTYFPQNIKIRNTIRSLKNENSEKSVDVDKISELSSQFFMQSYLKGIRMDSIVI